MAFDYNKETKSNLKIVLWNGEEITGELIEARVAVETIPMGKQWYQLRHSDDDWGEIMSIKRGCIVVNFFGTFICEPIGSMTELGEEIGIADYSYM